MPYRYVVVALTAASPVGEELIAIPAGIALGLPPVAVATTAMAFNFLPAFVITQIFARAEGSTTILRWLTRLRSRRLARALDRFGMPAVVMVAPWVGVYATAVTLELVGMQRRRILASIGVSLVAYAIIFTVGSEFFFG